MKTNLQPHVGRLGILFVAICVTTLTSCVEYSNRTSDVAPGYVESVHGIVPASYQNTRYGYGYAGANTSGNYHYYPRYGTYYNPQTRVYYYQRGSTWQTRSTPYGVSSRRLQSSHYVPLNIDGNLSLHHSRVAQSYPRNWSPLGQSHGRYSGPSFRSR
jgi:hypothetical protein